ncbi:MAG: DUF502 domain-containing protein [Gammaproteobacteria bacterium]|nr:DUF502 domain-containing protein [Gammaproteobacteria bacterium]
MTDTVKPSFLRKAQRYILTGVLTVIPLWLTFTVFEFFLRHLSQIGLPWARALSRQIEKSWPQVANWILADWFQNILAVLLTVLALYILGWIATRVIGRRIIDLFEYFIHRIPLVQSVYGAIKKFISVLQTKPDELQRVVLIEFPSRDMKTIGFVTRIMTDDRTGRQLAAVYVPTTPNPTSGYIEIIPVERLVSTDWSMDEAMTFIISGGAVAPDHIKYENLDESSQARN